MLVEKVLTARIDACSIFMLQGRMGVVRCKGEALNLSRV